MPGSLHLYCDIDSTVNNHWVRIRKWAIGQEPPRRIDPRAFTPEEVLLDEIAFDSVTWIRKFKEDGWNVHWLTARPTTLREATLSWLTQNGFPVDSLTLVKSAKDKPGFLAARKVDLFVDDLTRGHENDSPELYDDVIRELRAKSVPFEVFAANWEEIYRKHGRRRLGNAMKIGIIFCKDNAGAPQKRWLESYRRILEYRGAEIHVISDPSEVRPGWSYVWRPNHDSFGGKHQHSVELSLRLSQFADRFEKAGATLYPSSFDVSYYENKKRIHELCDERGIRAPKTVYCESVQVAEQAAAKIGFPVVVKHPYGCNSFAMFQCAKAEEFRGLIEKYFAENACCIVQEQLSIGKDLRINYVGNQSICSYWRVKAPGTFSTATRYGSQVDHFSVPEEGIRFADEVRRAIGTPMAGIDMAWKDDDLSGEPYLLEISPIFDLNPMPLEPVRSWARFKKSWGWKKHYRSVHLQVVARHLDYVRSVQNAGSKAGG